jgi:hypothetical protein
MTISTAPMILPNWIDAKAHVSMPEMQEFLLHGWAG